ncbi:MAG: SPOR domain-containing protein [Bacteroidales bacterium]|jgi:nucleoid DNA-binding protein|nr:SPOR domain-containing protein [Bacteroidales bacterium]
MKISEHIKTLLFQEDCVIIPGFGGFVGKYQEAKVDFRKSQLSPPVKIIAFNQKLQENDGLLIKHIAKLEKITYQQAETQVHDFVNRLKTALSQGKKVNLPEIGSFKMEKSVLVFSPENSINFHADAYGLESFEFPMLSTAKKQMPPPRKKQLEPVKSKKRRPNLVPLLIGLPLVALLAYSPIYFQNHEMTNKQETAGLSIPIKIQKQTPEMETLDLHKKNLEINAEVETPVQNPATPQAQTSQNNSGNVHIIAGSFASYNNAETAAAEYQQMGYQTEILPETQGMNRVTIKSYQNVDAAYAELNQLRNAVGNNGLWILQN